MDSGQHSFEPVQSHRAALWAVLTWVLSMAVLAALTVRLHADKRADLNHRFDAEVERITNDIQDRFASTVRGLMGVRGLYSASTEVSRQEFGRYVSSIDLVQEFPGLRGMGFIERVPRGQREAFEKAVKADGAPDFRIKFLSASGAFYGDLLVTKFIEPIERNRLALGVDVGSEANRRMAAETAMRSGTPTLTGAINLVQDYQSHSGFLLLVPVYRPGRLLDTEAQRQEALLGFAYSPIVLDELLEPAREMLLHSGLTTRVVEPGTAVGAKVLLEIGEAPPAPVLSRAVPLGALNSRLQLQFQTLPEFEAAVNLNLVYGLAGVGVLLNTLLALVVWLLLTAQYRAETLASRLTRDLEKLALVVKKTTNAVVMTGADLRITWVNDGFTRISGYTLEDALGKTPGDLLGSGKAPKDTLEALRLSAERGEGCRVEILNRAKDGHEYWIDTEVQPIRDDAGKLTGFIEIGLDITEDRLNNERLVQALLQADERQRALESEQLRVQNILTGTQAGTWEWHVPSGQTVFNERWAEIAGYRLAELEPVSIDTWQQLAHPDDLRHSTELLQKHFAGDLEYYECEARMRHKNGHWIWVMGRGKLATREADGSPGWMYGTQTDHTRQKTAELALRASKERLETLSELSAQWFWETDVEHRFAGFTCGDPQRLSQLQSMGLGKHRWELGAEPVNTSWQQHRETLERHEPFRDLIYRRVVANGSFQYWSVSGAPWHDDQGHFVGYIGTGTDITRSKRNELRIAQSEALLERTGKLARVGAWRLDLVSNLLSWSAQTCRIYEVPAGYQPTMAQALDHHPPQARQQIQAAFEAGINAGTGWDLEAPLVAADGQHKWVRTIGEVETIEGRPVALVGGIQDISEQKAQADALREAKAQAELASQFKSQFLANMSHEIRTPMNAILGMLKLLNSTPMQPRQLDYVQKAEGAAKSLLGLLNDILDFSKVEAGKMSLDLEPFQLDQMMRDVAVIFSSYAGGKPVEVLFDVDPQIPRRVVGDALRLQQILINLGSNAIKFTPEGNVVLKVGLEALSGEGTDQIARIHFAVQDSGIGIAPENQDKIFAGFTQAEASTTRRFGGTGLGLAISRRLIEMMGGQLALDSALGQGSTFSFTLPMPLAEAVDLPDHHPAGPPGAPSAVGAPVQVLFVDDNPVALQLAARMGRSLGWHVEVATSGRAAIEQMEQHVREDRPFQLLFVDCEMPGMDGWELASRIRALHAIPGRGRPGAENGPVIVMVTANGREALVRQTVEVQSLIDSYLVKPVTASMLLDAFQSALSPAQALANTRKASGPVLRPLAGLRILVVEDNAINQQVAEELISGQGARVDIAENGLRGVEALEASIRDGNRYHAILMDMQMPVMDGIAATRDIRERLGEIDIPIVAMTANAMSSDRELCLQAGMNDHIGKPFDLDRLVVTLLNWTKGRQVPELPEPPSEENAACGAPDEGCEDMQLMNREAALKRIGGSESLLNRMCTQFLKETPHLLDGCAVAVSEGDLKQAQKTLHTVKGVAATLGAERLACMARQGEGACKAGEAFDASGLLAVFQLTRQALLASGVAETGAVQEASDAVPEALALDGSEQRALARLRALLKESDIGAFDALEALKALPNPMGHSWHALERAIEAMQFEEAANLVDRLLNSGHPAQTV